MFINAIQQIAWINKKTKKVLFVDILDIKYLAYY